MWNPTNIMERNNPHSMDGKWNCNHHLEKYRERSRKLLLWNRDIVNSTGLMNIEKLTTKIYFSCMHLFSFLMRQLEKAVYYPTE